MKLYTALQLRKEYAQNLQSIETRIMKNLEVVENTKPAEDASKLLQLYNCASCKMKCLIRDINLTNAQVKFAFNDDKTKRTMTEALAERDELKRDLAILRRMALGATPQIRYNAEVTTVFTVVVTELQESADKLSKKLRLLEALIEEMNWKFELMSDFAYEDA